MNITFISSSATSPSPLVVPQYEIHIGGFNMTGQGVRVLYTEESAQGGMAELEFPRNRFMDLLFKKDAQVIIWSDKKNNSTPTFIGKLLEPTSELHPSTVRWSAVNGIRDFNLVPINAHYNRDNIQVYDANNKTGFYLNDVAEDALASVGGSLQFSKSSFPVDWTGEIIAKGERPIDFIRYLLAKSGQGKYSLRMKYNGDATQSLEAWKFGSTNNNSTYIIPGTINRHFTKAERGIANSNLGTYLEDCSSIINRIYAFGGKIFIEATIQLSPAWDSTLETALLNNAAGQQGSLLKDTNPQKYQHVFQRWSFPQWRVYDSQTGKQPNEWKFVTIYPKIQAGMLSDSLVPTKHSRPFILVHNPIRRGTYFFIGSYNLWYEEKGFSILQDVNKDDAFLVLDKELGMYTDTDGTFAGVRTKGELLYTGVFEIPQRIWVDSGKQGQESEEHIELFFKEDMKYFCRGYNTLGYNPNISGSDIFASSYSPVFSSTETLGSLDISSYVTRDDSSKLRDISINQVEYTKNRIKKILNVNYPRMDIAARLGDYEPYYQMNCIKIRHDFQRFITIKDFSNG